jgi:hypothetical protein
VETIFNSSPYAIEYCSEKSIILTRSNSCNSICKRLGDEEYKTERNLYSNVMGSTNICGVIPFGGTRAMARYFA